MVHRISLCLVSSIFLLLAGCHAGGQQPSLNLKSRTPCALALATGNSEEIASLQRDAEKADDPSPALQKIGWKYIEKARTTYDPGYYKLAEQCALCMETLGGRGRIPRTDALLLRGHALVNMHRFNEAEPLARELATSRGLAYDYGLLGDVLMEQGRLTAAIDAYQRMMDLRPGPEAYSRASHLRWLKGDLQGSIELMRMAAQAAGQGESGSWYYTRLAMLELQAGLHKESRLALDAALELHPDYAPALLARGRVLLAEAKADEAIGPLSKAAELNPLPEYQWVLADALRTAGKDSEAKAVEAQILARGGANDPRTLALFMATRGLEPETAIQLARNEEKVRGDVFTLDAIAWSLASCGRLDEATSMIRRALAEGTQDARLFYHAGMIAARAGRQAEARRYLSKSDEIRQMLLPSEREQLSHTRGV
jgi:tetratricopeptide (TPR) repeat protein